MVSFDELVNGAIADGVLQGLVICGRSTSGKQYDRTYGHTSLEHDAGPMTTSTPMQIASMTKLLTTIACLQLVDTGLTTLDTPISHLIPELVDQGILLSVDDKGTAKTKPVSAALTLRILLTHTSGSIYDLGFRKLERLLEARGGVDARTVVGRAGFPLLFEPGTSWVYGFGIDWAGLVLERITGSTLEDWMQAHICDPLGIKAMHFAPHTSAQTKATVPKIVERDFETGGIKHIADNAFLNDGNEGCFGGWGVITSMEEYVKVLHSLLLNDGRLLKKETANSMFVPQLGPGSKKALHRIMSSPLVEAFIGDFPDPEQYDFGLGGLLITKDNEGRRRKGTLTWSGMANCYWFIDRAAGVCGVFGTQVLPPGDEKVRVLVREFEFEMNRRLGTRASL